MNEITVHFLGTNGWYSSKTGNTLCILMDHPDHLIILDAGDGFSKIADLFPEVHKPAYLFLSHLHLDHISGLHTLARNRFQKGLAIYGPPGSSEIITGFIGSPYTIPIPELPFPVSVQELAPGTADLPFQVTTASLLHTQAVNGYRFDLGKVIAFCTDTGPCQGIVTLGSGADLLITECSFLPGQVNPSWPHMNPETAMEYSEKAGAKRLALVHFAADLYTSLEQRREIRQRYPDLSRLIIAEDGMSIRV